MSWGKFVWMNGELVKWEDAKVHVSAGALHYGICVFEGIRAYKTDGNLHVFRLKDHICRLYNSAKIYWMNIPFNRDELFKAVIETLKSNEIFDDCYIRPIVFRGNLPAMGARKTFESPVNVSIIVQLRKRNILTEAFIKGKRAVISSWRRISPDAMPPMAKCAANYANSVLAIMDSIKANVDYAIFLDSRGFVCEGPGQNIFIVKEGKLITPPLYSSILEGITRDTVIRIARDLNYDVIERDITRSELYTAEEIFLCGTACEIAPIVEIDKIKISDKVGEVTKRIASYFLEVVMGKVAKYSEWLTAVY